VRPLARALLLLGHQTLWEGSEPRPQGKTPQERPTLTWQMQPKGAKLQRVQMRLNGQPIPTRYDNETQSIVGEPAEPLPLGKIKATCEVWLSNNKGVDMEWEFTRVPLPPPPPAPDLGQREAIARLNQLRRAALLPDATLQPALCLAALRHSRYLWVNKLELTHAQLPSKPAFSGATPDERTEQAGYFESCYEVVAQGPSALQSIQNLVDAPYHRAALLQPGMFPAGVGIAGDRVTVLCGESATGDVLVYPADGQLNVPVQWRDTEIPDPLRLYPGATHLTGYPITLHLYGVTEKPELVEASLVGPNSAPVACYINTPANDDELDDMVLLIPQKPLAPLTSYQARIVVKRGDGGQVVRTWQFTTGKAPLVPRAVPPRAPVKPTAPPPKKAPPPPKAALPKKTK
jgi:hypothetical protein